jgi:hypothetical protein
MNAMGSIYIDEILFPITALHFDDGGLIVTAFRAGPTPAVNADHYDLYDRSGNRVYTCARRFQWSRKDAPGMELSLKINVLTAVPGDGEVVYSDVPIDPRTL